MIYSREIKLNGENYMHLNVNTLFRKMKLRAAETVLERVRNGSSYRLVNKQSSNGRGIGVHLEILDGIDSNEAIAEFLQNYLREGRLTRDTKKELQLQIRNLRKAKMAIEDNQAIQDRMKEKESIQESIYLDNLETSMINQVEGEEQMVYSSDIKYAYRSNSYEINDIIDFIIKARIENISPFILANKLSYPAGTVHTWYKDSNELRVLFTLYAMNDQEKMERFEAYDKEQIVAFNKDIRNLVISCENITDELRKKYLQNIDSFNELLKELLNETEEQSDVKRGNNCINVDVVKVITQTEEMWNAFANSNKEKIFEILYNDEEILSMVLKRIYN